MDVLEVLGNILDGATVPTLNWQEVKQYNLPEGCDIVRFFAQIAPPTTRKGGRMPEKIQGSVSKSRGIEVRIQTEKGSIYKQTWMYGESYNVDRYRKEQSDLLCLFEVSKKGSPAERVAKKVRREVAKNPQAFMDPLFTSVAPQQFVINPGNVERFTITGERLNTSAGVLVNTQNDSDMIDLYILTGQDHRINECKFTQTNKILIGSSWSVKVQIRNVIYKLIDISFIDDAQPTTTSVQCPVRTVASDDNPFDNTKEDDLLKAMERGNVGTLARLAVPLGDMLPEIQSESDGILELARKSGDLCTLLFVVVWKFVAKGVIVFNIFEKMRDYILTTKSPTFDGMLQHLPGIESIPKGEYDFQQIINSPVLAIPQNLPVVLDPASAIAVHLTHIKPLEEIFEVAPKDLTDEKTGKLYSLCNKPTLPHEKQDKVIEYLQHKISELFAGIPGEECFLRSLDVLLAIWDQEDISFCSQVLRDFIIACSMHAKQLVPLFAQLNPEHKSILYRTITRYKENFDWQNFALLLGQDDTPDSEKEAIVSLFPQISYVYISFVKSLLVTDTNLAIKIVMWIYNNKQVNFLRTFALQEKQNIWPVLRCISEKLATVPNTEFESIVSNLPFDGDIIDLIISEEEGTILQAEQQLNTLQKNEDVNHMAALNVDQSQLKTQNMKKEESNREPAEAPNDKSKNHISESVELFSFATGLYDDLCFQSLYEPNDSVFSNFQGGNEGDITLNQTMGYGNMTDVHSDDATGTITVNSTVTSDQHLYFDGEHPVSHQLFVRPSHWSSYSNYTSSLGQNKAFLDDFWENTARELDIEVNTVPIDFTVFRDSINSKLLKFTRKFSDSETTVLWNYFQHSDKMYMEHAEYKNALRWVFTTYTNICQVAELQVAWEQNLIFIIDTAAVNHNFADTTGKTCLLKLMVSSAGSLSMFFRTAETNEIGNVTFEMRRQNFFVALRGFTHMYKTTGDVASGFNWAVQPVETVIPKTTTKNPEDTAIDSKPPKRLKVINEESSQ